MKVTRFKKSEVIELTPEKREEAFKEMDLSKGKMIVSLQANEIEKKLAGKHKRPFYVKTTEILIVE